MTVSEIYKSYRTPRQNLIEVKHCIRIELREGKKMVKLTKSINFATVIKNSPE